MNAKYRAFVFSFGWRAECSSKRYATIAHVRKQPLVRDVIGVNIDIVFTARTDFISYLRIFFPYVCEAGEMHCSIQ